MATRLKGFSLVEEALDEVAAAVDVRVDKLADTDIALGGDVSCGAAGFDEIDNGSSKEAAVGNH